MKNLRKRILTASVIVVALVLITIGAFWYLGVARVMCYAYNWLPRKEVAGLMCLKFEMEQSKKAPIVRVYTSPSATDSQITELKNFFETHNLISSVDYRSADQQWEDFKADAADEPERYKAITTEVQGNPLGARFEIKIKDFSQKEMVKQLIRSYDTTHHSIIYSVY